MCLCVSIAEVAGNPPGGPKKFTDCPKCPKIIFLGDRGAPPDLCPALRKMRNRLREMNLRLNDVMVAAELSESIATFDLQKMAFLETLEVSGLDLEALASEWGMGRGAE